MKTWGSAEKSCNSITGPTGHGGNLVSIHSDDEMDFVKKLLNDGFDEYWIGLRMNCKGWGINQTLRNNYYTLRPLVPFIMLKN